MGKQGPCCHCGVASTPLWRNGPPEKPVLCNACGSRWRTKGSLENYTPLHARAEPDEYEEHRVSRVKSISINKNKEIKILKRKQNYNVAGGGIDFEYNLGFRKVVVEDTSNRSSSGSAISISESCAQFGHADASDLTGPAQSIVWESTVPSWKRTCVGRSKVSPVEKLTKDLYTILHEQQSSHFSGSSDEDLLFESETPMVSVEIGHGSVLIRHPSSIGRDEESEASSLSADYKQYPINEAYSHSMAVSVHNAEKGVDIQSYGISKFKNPASQGMQHELLKRDKSQFQILGHHNSPVCDVDLKKCKNSTGQPHVAGVPNGIALNNLVSIKRSSDSQNQRFPEAKTTMKIPKRVVTKTTYEHKELIDNDGSCFSPRSLFALPDSSSLMLDSFHFVEEISDHDLLLEVPSNNSFPQAELLLPTSSFGNEHASTNSSTI